MIFIPAKFCVTQTEVHLFSNNKTLIRLYKKDTKPTKQVSFNDSVMIPHEPPKLQQQLQGI
jgi:hypothetical protein